MTRPAKFTLLASAAAIALAGCTTAPGTPGNRTQEGAIAGAVLGGLFGATRNGDNRLAKTAVGAAIGAAVGGAIGQQLDAQAAELNQGFGNDEIDVINTGSELIVRMPQDIVFAVDSAAVRPDLRSDLNVLATSLGRYPNTTVQVTGHTDNTGSSSYNQDLSVRRANAVAFVLMDAGVQPSRIVAIGRGESQPIATNLTPEGRALNRRVDIVITPNG